MLGPCCSLCLSPHRGFLRLATPTRRAAGLTALPAFGFPGVVSRRRSLCCAGLGDDLDSVGLSEEAVALENGVKRQVVNLLKAVRLVMRSAFGYVLLALRFLPSFI